MKLLLLVFLITFIVIVECTHTFLGTSVLRPLIYHHDAQYSSKIFKKRVENLYFSLPSVPANYGRTIQASDSYYEHAHIRNGLWRKIASDHNNDDLRLNPGYKNILIEQLSDAKGILAYDKTNSGASANVTQGGLGYNFMNLRMKSDRGREIHYDVYIYA